MKNLTIIIFAVLFASSSFVSAQSEMTILKSFAVSDIAGDLEIGFSTENLEIVEWDEKVIRLEIVISSNVSEDVLRKLATVGRYELSLYNNSFLMTKTANAVFVKGVDLEEKFSVKIFVPKGFSYSILDALAHR